MLTQATLASPQLGSTTSMLDGGAGCTYHLDRDGHILLLETEASPRPEHDVALAALHIGGPASLHAWSSFEPDIASPPSQTVFEPADARTPLRLNLLPCRDLTRRDCGADKDDRVGIEILHRADLNPCDPEVGECAGSLRQVHLRIEHGGASTEIDAYEACGC